MVKECRRTCQISEKLKSLNHPISPYKELRNGIPCQRVLVLYCFDALNQLQILDDWTAHSYRIAHYRKSLTERFVSCSLNRVSVTGAVTHDPSSGVACAELLLLT